MEIFNEIRRKQYERESFLQQSKYIIISEDFYHQIKDSEYLIPGYHQQNPNDGDMIFGMKIAVRIGIKDNSWEIC